MKCEHQGSFSFSATSAQAESFDFSVEFFGAIVPEVGWWPLFNFYLDGVLLPPLVLCTSPVLHHMIEAVFTFLCSCYPVDSGFYPPSSCKMFILGLDHCWPLTYYGDWLDVGYSFDRFYLGCLWLLLSLIKERVRWLLLLDVLCDIWLLYIVLQISLI